MVRFCRRVVLSLLLAVAGFGCGSGSESVVVDLADEVGLDVAVDGAGADVVALPETVAEVASEVQWDLVPADLESELVGPAPGEPGAPCELDAECVSGPCIPTPDGQQCTLTCMDECPFDWVCRLYGPSLPDELYVCVPTDVDLCRPCLTNAECFTEGTDAGQACVDYGLAGNYCGSPCGDDTDCREGYHCEAALDVAGATVEQCVLDQGECTCTQRFVDVAATTSCAVTNDQGTCTGERLCAAAGLTTCDAPVPAAETCNGKDDNCNGETDEGLDGSACLVINDFGACPGVLSCVAGKEQCQGKEAKAESCDGEDNDCDGDVDEGYPDTDGDGEADCLETDKDGDGIADGLDNCPMIFNPQQADADLDGQGDPCDLDDDNDMTADDLDCAPLDGAIHPGADELCDGLDNNCNYIVDEGFVDSDTDGWKDCVDEDDDNDGSPDVEDCAPLDKQIFPGAPEICDGLDNDCDEAVDEDFADTDEDGQADCVDSDQDGDGITDEVDNCPLLDNPDQADQDQDGFGDLCDPEADGDGIPNATDNCLGLYNPGQADADQDGQGDLCDDDVDGDGSANDADCGPTHPGQYPGAPELCDGLDNDCDEVVDEDLGEITCGKGACFHAIPACNNGLAAFCDPYEGAAVESCDGLDNDCDGLTDEDQGSTVCGKGECFHSQPNCVMGQQVECDPLLGAAEEVCDGVDNDCDGQTDEGMPTLACGKGQCFHTTSSCVGGITLECNPFDGATMEVCDGQDNDCDGQTDEGLGETTCGLGNCIHTQPNCANGVPQLCNPLAGAAMEACDGEDNDCDGIVDEELGSTTCGKGLCEHTVLNCVDGQPNVCEPLDGAVPEECDKVDNDCDGLVDEDFPDTDSDGTADCLDTDDDGDLVLDDDDNCPTVINPDQLDLDNDGLGNLCDPDADDDGVLDESDNCLLLANGDQANYDEDDLGDACDPDDDNDNDPDETDCAPLDETLAHGLDDLCYDGLDNDCSGLVDDDPACLLATCLAIHEEHPELDDGPYVIDPDGMGGAAAFSVYCDMSTDGGGWTIVYASNGANGNVGLVSDSEQNGNPLEFAHYNVNRTRKMAIAALCTESLFKRDAGTWLQTTHPLFDQNLAGDSHQHFEVTVTANDGTSAPGWMGYSTFNISGGGDFNVSVYSGQTCNSTMVQGLDHHSTSYYHLNCGCEHMYLYCYSGKVKDGDAAYDVNTALGSWTVTNGCNSDETGGLHFFAAMR